MPRKKIKLNCPYCNQEFTGTPDRMYCSRNCYGKSKQRPAEERFWAKVSKLAISECWNWQGAKTRDGYGSFGIQGTKTMLAHRYSFMKEFGYLPTEVAHTCDNPACVNPSHLRDWSHLKNMQDAAYKKRMNSQKGESNGASKYQEHTIKYVFYLYEQGCTQQDISRRTGISQSHISRILRKENWSHLT